MSQPEAPPGYAFTNLPRISAGQAEIQQATDANGQLVAIKFPKRGPEHDLRRFEREIEVYEQYPSDWMPQYVTSSTTEPQWYLITRWCHGGSLEKRLTDLATQKQTISERDAVAFVGHLAAICAQMHNLGIIHRDLHPKNILFNDATFAQPKLIDFGLAKRQRDSEEQVDPLRTQMGVGWHTGSYSAPEMYHRAATADERADIYSIGAILFRLLEGKPPPSADQQQREVKLSFQTTPPLLQAVIQQCMQYNPADRYATAVLLSDALTEYLHHGRLPATVARHATPDTIQRLRTIEEIRKSYTGGDDSKYAINQLDSMIRRLRRELNDKPTTLLTQPLDPRSERNLLYYAIEAQFMELIEYLVETLDFHVQSDTVVFKRGRRGDDPARDHWGWTPLHLAASLGNHDIVEYLLKRGADPLARTEQGATVIYEAAFAANDSGAELMELMLGHCELGKDKRTEVLNLASNDGFTPLMIAAWRDNPLTVQYLLEQGVELNRWSDRGESAFELAVLARSPAIAKALVRSGWNCPDYTPTHKRLTTSGARDDYSDLREAREGLYKALRRKIEKDDDFPQRLNVQYEPFMRTILHEAAANGHYSIVSLLCTHEKTASKIDVFLRNNHGRKASDLVPKHREEILTLLHEKEEQARHE